MGNENYLTEEEVKEYLWKEFEKFMKGQVDKRFNVGLVKVTVWKNVSKTGDEFKTVSLNRSYQKEGEWKNTNSFGVNDIDKAIDVLKQARDYVNGKTEEEIVA